MANATMGALDVRFGALSRQKMNGVRGDGSAGAHQSGLLRHTLIYLDCQFCTAVPIIGPRSTLEWPSACFIPAIGKPPGRVVRRLK